MTLKSFLDKLSRDQREAFAEQCGSSAGHIKNIGYGYKPCAEILAVAIERESQYQVTRPDLRPCDWWLIWPELIPLYTHLLPSDHPEHRAAA
ncbi:hypothetical protein [Chitinimonas naiadis]